MQELQRRKPTEGSHRQVVGSSLMGSELPIKIGERKEAVGVIESFPFFSVTSFDLTVVARCIGTNKFMAYAEFGGSLLE